MVFCTVLNDGDTPEAPGKKRKLHFSPQVTVKEFVADDGIPGTV